MSRRTFDSIVSSAGIVVALVLLVAGGLVLWGSSFVHNQVGDQLASQKIFFPPRGSEALTPEEYPGLQHYAGQQVVNGDQAAAYADQFIAKHLAAVADGKTYAEVSGAALQNPDDEQLQAQAQTLFRGTTLRGLLLNAHAFWTMGDVMEIVAIVLFVGGGVLTVMAGLGFWHAARASASGSGSSRVRLVEDEQSEERRRAA